VRCPPALLLAALLPLLASRAPGLVEGETYDQLLAEKGPPKSQVQVGARRILTYPDAVVKLANDVVVSIQGIAGPKPPPPPAPPAPVAKAPSQAPVPADEGAVTPQVADARAKLGEALAKARAMINQPVTSYPMTEELRAKASLYEDGWFHPGADIPNFIDIHIERSQEPYGSQYEWVTSNLTPGLVFRSADCEYNAATKFFYMDRTVPKKKLTQPEMLRLDAIYHQIGVYSAYLLRLGHPWTPTPGGP
jgi:hypothetical protein